MRPNATGHRIIKAILIATAMLLFAAAASPKVRLGIVWASGRCHGCTFRAALASHDLLMDMAEAGKRIGAASRVVETDPAGFELVETPAGRFWTVPHDKFLRFTLAEEQLAIYGRDSGGVHPGDIVLDCGANVGAFTRAALRRGAGRVVAIEPAPRTVECLRRNFAPEIAQGRVVVVPEGVWDHTDVLDLSEAGDGNTTGDSFVFSGGASRKVRVPLTTIDLLAANLKLPRVDFVKMDIEGAEKQALRGGAETIRRYHPRMAIASEHLPDDATAIPQLVNEIDSSYRVQFSSCKDDFLSIAPEVLLFQAARQ